MNWVLIWLLLLVLWLLKHRNHLLSWAKKRAKLLECMKKLPGPAAWPIVGSTPLFYLDRDEWTNQLEHWASFWHKEGLMRIWFGPIPIVAIVSADMAQAVLTSHQEVIKIGNDLLTQAELYIDFLGDGILLSKGEKWRRHRRLLGPAFHQAILNEFVPIFNKQSRIFVNKLGEMFVDGPEQPTKTFDILDWLKRYSLDVITETSFGRCVGAQLDMNSNYHRALEELMRYAYIREKQPWFWLNPIWNAVHGKQYNQAKTTFRSLSRRLIKTRRAELQTLAKQKGCSMYDLREGRKALPALDIMLMASPDDEMTDDEIADECDTLINGGIETTALNLNWTLFYLGHHQDIQQKVHDELESVFGGDDRDCTPEDMKRLRYLNMCIKEALRLAPSAPMLRRVLTEDTMLGKYLLPKDTIVVISTPWVQRDPKHWCKPHEFDPERFNPDHKVARHPTAYIPFSYGLRNCIGQQFANMEVKAALSKLLRHYRFESMQSINIIRGLPEAVFKPSGGFPMRLFKRL